MSDSADQGPLYDVERDDEGRELWRVTGPNGLVGVFETVGEAQARADHLNEQVAEETENDS